jgi:hypothetical protein
MVDRGGFARRDYLEIRVRWLTGVTLASWRELPIFDGHRRRGALSLDFSSCPWRLSFPGVGCNAEG